MAAISGLDGAPVGTLVHRKARRRRERGPRGRRKAAPCGSPDPSGRLLRPSAHVVLHLGGIEAAMGKFRPVECRLPPG
jgi:hypothetical protein